MESRIRGIAIIIKDEKLLLIQQWDSEQHQYLIPPGGGVENDESIYECIEREVLEETGLKVKPERLIAIRQFKQSHINRNSIELFSLCELLGDMTSSKRTSRELYYLGQVLFVDLKSLKKYNVFPTILKNYKWFKKILTGENSEVAVIVEEEQLQEKESVSPQLFPDSFKKKYAGYFGSIEQLSPAMSNDEIAAYHHGARELRGEYEGQQERFKRRDWIAWKYSCQY